MLPLKRMGFFKTRKNKQFNYKPIYFDPEKEGREARKKKREISFRNEDSEFKKRNFGDSTSPYKDMQTQLNRRMLILTGMIAALLILGYYLWFKLMPFLK